MDRGDSNFFMEHPLLVPVNINSLSDEVKQQVKLGEPLAWVSLLQYSLQMISIVFLGHLGQLSFSSASLATSFAGVTGFGFMVNLRFFFFLVIVGWMGMASALETFCGQAYGAKQYHIICIHMQRDMLVLMLMCVPISLIWTYTGFLFTCFGQDLEISNEAGIYARWLIPSIFVYGLLQCQLRFLQTQKIIRPLIINTAVTSLVHILLCWTLVFSFGFGSKGAALSCAISHWINVLILAIYIKFSPKCEKTWTGFSVEGARNLYEFLSLGIPAALMVCLEKWAFEFLILMSGLLPNPKLETSMMSISLNTTSLFYKISFGFGSAVSTRFSNELGAGNPRAAQLAARAVVCLAVGENLAISLILIAVRGKWGYLYSNEEEVVSYLASVMPVLALSTFMDGIQAVLSGVARGCGWQMVGTFVNLGAYYLVGLPCAIILTFVYNFGGKGLWMGIIYGRDLQALVLLAITICTNWEKEESVECFEHTYRHGFMRSFIGEISRSYLTHSYICMAGVVKVFPTNSFNSQCYTVEMQRNPHPMWCLDTGALRDHMVSSSEV